MKANSLPTSFTFSDLTSWNYQKTYTTSTLEEKVWSFLSPGDEVIEELKFKDFFKNYAEILYEKHQKTMHLRRKVQKIVKLKKRTMKYFESLENLLHELGYKGLNEVNLWWKGVTNVIF